MSVMILWGKFYAMFSSQHWNGDENEPELGGNVKALTATVIAIVAKRINFNLKTLHSQDCTKQFSTFIINDTPMWTLSEIQKLLFCRKPLSTLEDN